MIPPRPVNLATRDCPAWIFDAALTIPAAAGRLAAPAARQAAPARPGPPAESPTLFRKER